VATLELGYGEGWGVADSCVVGDKVKMIALISLSGRSVSLLVYRYTQTILECWKCDKKLMFH
jgi:hypothetical protein